MNLPPYKDFPNITGNKILLRQVLRSDLKDIIEISFYNRKQAKSLEEATMMLDKIDNDYMEGNSIHWGIAFNSTNILVGTCGYYRGFDNGEGELGCILLPHFRGQGFMLEAMQLAIDFGFNSIGLKRIWAITSKHNFKAVSLLNRLSFIRVKELQNDEIEFEKKKLI